MRVTTTAAIFSIMENVNNDKSRRQASIDSARSNRLRPLKDFSTPTPLALSGGRVGSKVNFMV